MRCSKTGIESAESVIVTHPPPMRPSPPACSYRLSGVLINSRPAWGSSASRAPTFSGFQETHGRDRFDNGGVTNGAGENVGTLIEINGVVIDAVFPNKLPEIYSALRSPAPRAATLIAEVQQHLGDDRIRAVAMDTTDGLSRGVDVVDTGAPISVPVGDATLGRVWNVLGDPIDGRAPAGGAALADPPRPAGLRRALVEGRDLRDRDQGHRPDRPVRARRQYRPLRRRRRRQDRADPGADREPRPRARRRLRLLRRRRAHPRGQRPPARDAGARVSSTRSRSATAR